MIMPQDFVDAINEAVRKVNPNTNRVLTNGSMTLGSDFDRWIGPDAFMKWGLDPLPLEEQKAFQAKFEEHRERLKQQVVESAVDIEKRRMSGTLVNYTFNDSNRKENV